EPLPRPTTTTSPWPLTGISFSAAMAAARLASSMKGGQPLPIRTRGVHRRESRVHRGGERGISARQRDGLRERRGALERAPGAGRVALGDEHVGLERPETQLARPVGEALRALERGDGVVVAFQVEEGAAKARWRVVVAR